MFVEGLNQAQIKQDVVVVVQAKKEVSAHAFLRAWLSPHLVGASEFGYYHHQVHLHWAAEHLPPLHRQPCGQYLRKMQLLQIIFTTS